MADRNKIIIDYFFDVLCVWAYIAQVRVEEVERCFPDQVEINYRVCTVFADSEHKIANGWASRGGYEGFADHLQEVAAQYDHIKVNPDCWRVCRPASSTPAHLSLKAVQKVAPEKFEAYLHALRCAFFEDARDIADADVLREIQAEQDLPVDEIRGLMRSGKAYAMLESDARDRVAQSVSGSPTYILNESRQKLYGNVGYGVIEANLKELLKSPHPGSASWC